jgi:hypothetical protein
MKEDLCYLPTQGLCKINDILDNSFFPDNRKNVMSQELITYYKGDKMVKKVTFKRTFLDKRHVDSTSTEIFNIGEN